MKDLTKLARGQSCIRCGRQDETIVFAHYTGARRLAYNGGYGIKVNDLLGADLCSECHQFMDTLSRDKDMKWEHSEEFLHYIALTIIRRANQGHIKW